jgi:hypothetical protein
MFSPAIFRPFQKQKMLENCEVCHLHFEIEAGFYWGAMYFSYALNVAESVTLSFIIYFLTGSHSPWLYSGIIILFILLSTSFNFRYGRILLLYLFGDVKYQGESY